MLTKVLPREFYHALVVLHIRDGTGQDFLDPTRPVNFKIIAGFFTEGFCSLFNVSNEKFSKGGAWVRY